MDTEHIYEVRKANVKLLLQEKFHGVKIDLAKAARVMPNTISLLLTHNEAHKRNLGEQLARKLERNLLLPVGWFDTPHTSLSTSSPYTIHSADIDPKLTDVLRACEIPCFCVPEGWTDALPHLTARENLYIATVATDEAAPDISPGAWVMVDGAARAWNGSGYYILSRERNSFMRHVTRKVTGEYWVTGGPKSTARGEVLPNLKGLKVYGRLVAHLPHPALLR